MTLAQLVAIASTLGSHPSPSAIRRLQVIAPIVERVAPEYGVDPFAQMTVIWHESRGRQSVVGPLGEIGVSQISPKTAEFCAKLGMDVRKLRDNIRCGAIVIGLAMDRCGPDPLHWLSFYNSGRTCRVGDYSARVVSRLVEADATKRFPLHCTAVRW